MTQNEQLLLEMAHYEQGCMERFQHLLKVYEFAKLIGHMEQLDEQTQLVLETAAIVHDIGIRPALEKYGTDAGPYQEKEGILPAKELLEKLGYSSDVVERVCYLVGHHHTYTGVDGLDYQILLEADYLVNSFENHHSKDKIRECGERFFRTSSGYRLLFSIYEL